MRITAAEGNLFLLNSKNIFDVYLRILNVEQHCSLYDFLKALNDL